MAVEHIGVWLEAKVVAEVSVSGEHIMSYTHLMVTNFLDNMQQHINFSFSSPTAFYSKHAVHFTLIHLATYSVHSL